MAADDYYKAHFGYNPELEASSSQEDTDHDNDSKAPDTSSSTTSTSKRRATVSLYSTRPVNLTSHDLSGIANYIKSDKCNNIMVLCGAGISVSAGIPDFRSVGGFYKTLNTQMFDQTFKYNKLFTQTQLNMIKMHKEYILSFELFKLNPIPYYQARLPMIFTSYLNDIKDYVKKNNIDSNDIDLNGVKTYEPTLTHWFFKLLYVKKYLKRIYSTNIDGLQAKTGFQKQSILPYIRQEMLDKRRINMSDVDDEKKTSSVTEMKTDNDNVQLNNNNNNKNDENKENKENTENKEHKEKEIETSDSETILVSIHGRLDEVYCIQCYEIFNKTKYIKYIINLKRKLELIGKVSNTNNKKNEDTAQSKNSSNMNESKINCKQDLDLDLELLPLCCDKCNKKNNFIKPAIILFEEPIHDNFWNIFDCGSDLKENCDLLIIAGTSLTVAPSNKIPFAIDGKNCPRLIANMTEIEAKYSFGERPFVYDYKLDSGLDVWIQDECDKTFLKLCKLLGWVDQFYQLLVDNDAAPNVIDLVKKEL